MAKIIANKILEVKYYGIELDGGDNKLLGLGTAVRILNFPIYWVGSGS